MPRLGVNSPMWVFTIVLAVVFAVELAIMLVVEAVDAPRGARIAVSILDALVLVIVLCPVLWILVVRPLQATIAERGAMLSRTFQVQEEERARLAHELHDELGQVQSAVLLGARSIVDATSLDGARERAADVARMASAAIESSRRIARGLAPSVLIDLGLAVAAERLCEDAGLAGGIEIERSIELGPDRLAKETEFAAYRVLQEALTNGVKHAHATRIQVELASTQGELRLIVADDGGGIAPDVRTGLGRGFGLRGMRERVLLRNGTFAVAPTPGGGTTIRATFPLVHDEAGP